MNLNRRRLLAAMAGCAAPFPALASGGQALSDLIRSRSGTVADCGPSAAAVRGSMDRAVSTDIPVTGRSILVNVPSRALVAYERGIPVLEMRVVPGAPRTPTPEMSTTLQFVRLNPTWTVPASILRERVWRTRMADPSWMARHGFSRTGGRVVQRPGPSNALGLVKFGLRNANGIFLHDTNEPEGFARDGLFASHGCIRLERPFALASWVLGIDEDELVEMQKGGDRRDRIDFEPVAVTLSYLTAWPGGDGSLTIHPDIYRRDPPASSCRPSSRNRSPLP